MDNNELHAIIEAMLLTATGPVATAALVESFEQESTVTEEAIGEVLKQLQQDWDEPSRGIRLEQVAGGWRAVTPAQLDPWLASFHGVQTRQRLSQAALEVLSIVAYRQPVTLPEVNFIRGTNSSHVMRTLLERKLVRLAGRKKVVGKPFLYRTTKEFLIHFGLDSVGDLPEPEAVLGDDTTIAE